MFNENATSLWCFCVVALSLTQHNKQFQPNLKTTFNIWYLFARDRASEAKLSSISRGLNVFVISRLVWTVNEYVTNNRKSGDRKRESERVIFMNKFPFCVERVWLSCVCVWLICLYGCDIWTLITNPLIVKWLFRYSRRYVCEMIVAHLLIHWKRMCVEQCCFCREIGLCWQHRIDYLVIFSSLCIWIGIQMQLHLILPLYYTFNSESMHICFINTVQQSKLPLWVCVFDCIGTLCS